MFCIPWKASKDLPARASVCLQFAFDVFEFHFSSTDAENTPKKPSPKKEFLGFVCLLLVEVSTAVLKVSSFWFIKAIFQLDWDAYLSPLRGACWVYSAADLLEV